MVYKKALLSFFILSFVLLLAQEVKAVETIQFSIEEKAWIKGHPIIRLGAVNNVEPILIEKQDNALSGIAADFVAAISQRSGLNIKLVPGTMNQLLEMVEQKTIDGIALMHAELADKADLLKTKIHIKDNVSLFAKKGNSIQDTDDLIGKTIVHIDGAFFADRIIAPYKDKIKIVTVSSGLKMLKTVLAGDADFALGLSLETYKIGKYGLSSISDIYSFKHDPVKTVTGIRSDLPMLVPILNKTISSFSAAELNTFIEKWKQFSTDSIDFTLSAEEKQWVENHPVITLAIDNTYPPLNYIDDNGKLTGLSVDFVKQIADKIGISLDFKGSVWSMAIKKALDHEVDGIVNAAALEKRKQYLNFTRPYAYYPNGLVTLKTAGKLGSMENLGDKIICVKRNSSQLGVIKERTNAQIYLIETLEEGLELVMSKEAHGVFDDVSVLGYLISKYNFANLKIDFIYYDEKNDGTHLGLRNDDPIMLSVFNKAIQSVTKKEKEKVQSRWLSFLEEKTIVKKYFDWVLFIKIALPICVLFLVAYILIFFHNKRLQKVVEIRTTDLKKSQEQFRVLIDNAADAIFVHDFKGRILIANKQASKNLGYSAEELLDMSVLDIEAKFPDPEKLFNYWNKLTLGHSLTIEGVHRRKDNTIFPVEVQIGLIETTGQKTVQAIVRDITKRKESERERILLATAIEQANETVVMTDMDGIIQYVNPAFERITGYTRNEAVGQNPRMLKSDSQSEEFYNDLWQTITSGNTWHGHLVNRKKDGQLYEENATISPVFDSSKKISNFLAVKRDVTKEVELRGRLDQAQKMESIGTLAGGIAHDFNNILSAILGYTELAMADLDEKSNKRKELNHVMAAGYRATDLVRQILTFSRKSELQLIPVKVQSIIRDSLKLLRPSIPATIDIRQDIDPDCGNVLADPTLIHQVVMNLCTNAYHAMRLSGGVLTICLQRIHLTSNDVIDEMRFKNGFYLKLEVNDTGIGIPENLKDKIFDPYFTTKTKGEGTGLGLAVVHGIIKSINGEVSVRSKQDVGTSFHVYLPEIEAAQPIQKEKLDPLPTGNERILIIDDEEGLLLMHQKIIESLGYEVTAISSSMDAFSILEKTPDAFDLVITDMTMPMLTGADLAGQMLGIRPDLPIILCTGYSELITAKEAEDMGICKFVLKPISKRTIAGMIRETIDKKQQER